MLHKVLILGQEGVGKTQLVKNKLNVSRTTRADYTQMQIESDTFAIWDTSGSPIHDMFISAFFSNASLAILVHNNAESLHCAWMYYYRVKQRCKNCCFVFVSLNPEWRPNTPGNLSFNVEIGEHVDPMLMILHSARKFYKLRGVEVQDSKNCCKIF
jgi:GTPase SAR1 family protein